MAPRNPARSQARLEPFSSAWNALFLKTTNIQHAVAREQQVNAAANAFLEDFPTISKSIWTLSTILIEDFSSEGFEGACIECFLRNNISTSLLHLGTSNVPRGMFNLVLDFNSALLTSLPPHFFLHDRISRPIFLLLQVASERIGNSRGGLDPRGGADIDVGVGTDTDAEVDLDVDVEKIVRVLDHLTARICEFPPLKELFLETDGCSAIFCATKKLLELGHHVNSTSLQSIILRSFSLELIDSAEGDSEDLLISLVFCLVSSFSSSSFSSSSFSSSSSSSSSSNDTARFTAQFIFLERCIVAAQKDAILPAKICSVYRDHFVNCIFAMFLRQASEADGSLGRLVELLLTAMKNSTIPDLLLPLLGRAVRGFELLNFSSEDCHEGLMKLYGEAAASPILFRSFPSSQPCQWTESAALHRQRCHLLFSTLPRLSLRYFSSVSALADLYRTHLMAMDSTIPDTRVSTLNSEDAETSFPLPLVGPTYHEQVLDLAKLQRLKMLFEAGKRKWKEGFWQMSLQSNLCTAKFICGILSVLDNPELYGQLDQKNPDSLLSALDNVVASMPSLAPQDAALEALVNIHTHSDALEPSRWEPIATSGQPKVVKTANAYLLGHVLLRLSAIIQVRATRPSTTIIYE